MRAAIAPCLWSGCISAAKVLSAFTNDGPNAPESGEYAIKEVINPIRNIDHFYRAGAEPVPVC